MLGGFSLGLALVVSAVVAEFSERKEHQTITQALERTASEMSQRFSSVLDRRATTLAAMANQIQASRDSRETQRAVIKTSLISVSDHAWAAFVDPSGIIQVATDSEQEGSSLQGKPIFEQAREKPFLQSLPISRGKSPLLEMSAPVVNEKQQFLGVVCARFDWDWLQHIGENVLSPFGSRWQLQILIVDRNGSVLVASGSTDLVGSHLPRPEIEETDTPAGFLAARADDSSISKELRQTGWRIVVRQPQAIALGPARDLRWEIMAGGLACGLAFALVGWFVSGRIVRPLATIAKAAGEIARGDSRPFLPMADEADEFVGLVDSLNGLLKAREEQTGALRESETRLRLATEAAGIGIWTWDLPTGRVTCSPECAAIFGQDRVGLSGHVFLRLVHREDRSRIWKVIRQALATKTAYEYEFRFTRSDGSIRWAASRGRAEYDAKGKPVRLMGAVSDITARKESERAIADQARLLDLSCDAIMVRDSEERIIFWNRGAEHIYGWPSADALGKPSHELLKTQFPISQESIAGHLQREGRWEGEVVHTRRDGTRITVMTRWVLDRDADGRTVAVMESNTDITEQKRSEEALRESEERSRSLFENNIDGIFSLDMNGYFTDANPAALRLSDYTMEELRTMTFAQLTAPDKLEEALGVFKQVLAGATIPIETALIDRHGRRVELIVHGTPIMAHGNLVGVYGVVADITDKKRAEEALRDREQMLSVAIDAAKMGTWDWDIGTNQVRWSERTRQILGVADGEPLSLEIFYAKLHPDDRTMVAARIEKSIHGEGIGNEVQYRVVRPDGSIRWVSAIGRMLNEPSRDRSRLVGVIFDVTDSVNSARDLSIAKEEAEAANRAKDDFLAALSHELRTPLNPVLMLASELAESPELPPRVRNDFAMIRKNVTLEARLIDDLLDITRITRGKLLLQLQDADVHTLLYQSFELLRSEAGSKQLIISFDLSAPERMVHGDPVRLQQVFWNVIKNAVKFTPAGGSITLRTRQGSGQAVVVEIMDSGMGIDPQELPRIFDAFAQGTRSEGHRFGGLGLGLSISKLLVQLHHGRIDATSHGLGKGAIFRIELPLGEAESSSESPPQSPEPAPAVHPLRLLLIEDHEPTRATLCRLLSRRGHKVSAAETATTARALAAAAEFDFVISDIGLPDGNGQDLMVELRDNYGLSGIALSGYGREEDIHRSLESGFIAHLVKPIDIQALEIAMAGVTGGLPAPGAEIAPRQKRPASGKTRSP